MRVFPKYVFLSCGLIFLVFSSLKAQTYRNLVFEGAGIRGVAYAGALMQLQEQKILDKYKTCWRNFRWCNYSFSGFDRITFRQLHVRGFKDLYITGTSLNRQKIIVFSHENYPNMKVRDAIRISMSIPLYYEAVHIDSSGKIVQNPKDTKGLDVMVDGGILGNFPIQIFDSTKYFSANAYMETVKNAFAKNPETLGVRIDSDEQINADKNIAGLAPYEINEFADYVSAFYNIILENLNRQSLDEADWKRTISVSSKDIGPKVKKLSDAQKNILLESGKAGVKVFFSK
ncbi:MAG: hypothetical protein EOP53_23155 [Sphingobacteriales bacterium]|nr:MAG: hypothetical protein EOP53_23155 [Sphingobacteriales bacterium]